MQYLYIKTQSGLMPYDPQAQEQFNKIKHGKALMVDIVQPRNGKFHRKFFALLNLAYEYWEPTGGLVPDAELNGIQGFARFIDDQTTNVDISSIADIYIEHLTNRRKERYPAVEKSFEALRSWVTVEAGFFELVYAPNGLKKIPKSISFAKMDETEFAEVYRAVFGVCWRLVLQYNFESEAQCEHVLLNDLGEFAA